MFSYLQFTVIILSSNYHLIVTPTIISYSQSTGIWVNDADVANCKDCQRQFSLCVSFPSFNNTRHHRYHHHTMSMIMIMSKENFYHHHPNYQHSSSSSPLPPSSSYG